MTQRPVMLPSFRTGGLDATTTTTTSSSSSNNTATGRLLSFWNSCGENLRNHDCATGSSSDVATNCSPFVDTTCVSSNVGNEMDDDDDDDSIIERRQAKTATTTTTTTKQRVRQMVDGLFTPIMQCVQPPLQSCITTPVEPWIDPTNNSTSTVVYTENHYNYNKQDQRPIRLQPPTSHHPYSKQRNQQHQQHQQQQQGIQYTLNTGGKVINPNDGTVTTVAASVPVPSTLLTTAIRVHDVLCGRGNGVNQHPGNIHFRQLIHANCTHYPSLTKKEKMTLAQSIVHIILYHTQPPGRFIAKDTVTGVWNDIGLARSMEKVSQAFREQSAITPSIKSVVSLDENDTNSSTTTEQPLRDGSISMTGASHFSRASTVKMSNSCNTGNNVNHRGGRYGNHGNALTLPSIIIPDQLCNIYQNEPCSPYPYEPSMVQQQQQQQQQLLLPPRSAKRTPMIEQSGYNVIDRAKNDHSTESLPSSQQHATHSKVGVIKKSTPILSCKKAPPPNYVGATEPTTTTGKSPTRGNSSIESKLQQQRYSSVSNFVIITPNGTKNSTNVRKCMDSTMTSSPKMLPIIYPSTSWDQRVLTPTSSSSMVAFPEPTSPIFPFNTFHELSYNNKNALFTTSEGKARDSVRNNHNVRDPLENHLPTISPPREQLHTKRQRTSKNLLDDSFDSVGYIDVVDSSLEEEGIEATFDEGVQNSGINRRMSMSTVAATTTITSNCTTVHHHHLVEAIGTKLTLEDQSSNNNYNKNNGHDSTDQETTGRTSGSIDHSVPRRRFGNVVPSSQQQPQLLPRPPKVTAPLDISADSVEDGLAALSTAAYLRLDDSY